MDQKTAITIEQNRLPLTFVVGPGPALPLMLPAGDYRRLFDKFGPSLALWRAAEIAVLREQYRLFEPPVLDLGCGDGLVSSMALGTQAGSIDLGLDPDARALAKAAMLGTYRRLIPSTAQDCGLEHGSVGTILSNSVLEHIEDIDDVLAAVWRLLRPGGRLIFTVPTEAFGPWLVVPSARYAGWRNRRLLHRNLWPAESWAAHLAAAGFEVEVVRPYLARPLVAAWDGLDLVQQVWIGRRRAFGMLWKRLPEPVLDVLARRAARINLAAPEPGGGRLVVARKREAGQ
jgi:SAM-dependent methyltransferase